jgi:hypothetical protein
MSQQENSDDNWLLEDDPADPAARCSLTSVRGKS